MRIAIWHNLLSGGGQRALTHQVAGFVHSGDDVVVFAPPSAVALDVPDGVSVHVVGDALPEPPHSPREALTFLPSRHRKMRAAALRQAEVTATAIGRGSFDVVLAHPCRTLMVTPLAHGVEVPAVLYLQEPNRRRYEALPELPWAVPPTTGARLGDARARVIGLVDTVNLRHEARQEIGDARAYDLVLVNSSYSRESLRRCYAIDAEVCRLGIDTELFAERRDGPRQEHLLCVGSFTPAKDPLGVIGAVAAMRSPRPLRWIANAVEPDLDGQGRRLAERLGVDFDLRVAVSDDELVEAYSSARALVYAPRLEPLGFAPLEAAACALPTVAVAEGGCRETIVDGVTGWLAPDARSLPGMLDAALADDDGLRRAGAAGRELVVERWSLAGAAAALRAALERTIKACTVP